MILPPGKYRFTLRARGYLDLSEIINVDILKSPIYHVFYMKHVGGLSPAYRLYVVSMIGKKSIQIRACILSQVYPKWYMYVIIFVSFFYYTKYVVEELSENKKLCMNSHVLNTEK